MTKEKLHTHTGTLITKDGNKTVNLRESATTWTTRLKGKTEAYDKQNGRRCGAPLTKRRLLLATIQPVEQEAET